MDENIPAAPKLRRPKCAPAAKHAYPHPRRPELYRPYYTPLHNHANLYLSWSADSYPHRTQWLHATVRRTWSMFRSSNLTSHPRQYTANPHLPTPAPASCCTCAHAGRHGCAQRRAAAGAGAGSGGGAGRCCGRHAAACGAHRADAAAAGGGRPQAEGAGAGGRARGPPQRRAAGASTVCVCGLATVACEVLYRAGRERAESVATPAGPRDPRHASFPYQNMYLAET